MNIMNLDDYNESYVYSYENTVDGMIYYGARWAYSKNSDKRADEDFDISYKSSSCSRKFRKDMEAGLLRGEILMIFSKKDLPVEAEYEGEKFIIEDLVTLALYHEDKLIADLWSTKGKKYSYNKVRNFRKDRGFYRVENRTEYYNSEKCKLIAAESMRKRQMKGRNKASRQKANETNKANHGGVLSMHTAESRAKQRESDKLNHGGVRAWDTPESIEKRVATFMQNNDPISWLNSQEAMDKKNATNLERYGSINHTNLLNTEEAKRKSHEYYLYITDRTKLRFMTRNSATRLYPNWIKLCRKSECDERIRNLVELGTVIDPQEIKDYINNLLGPSKN